MACLSKSHLHETFVTSMHRSHELSEIGSDQTFPLADAMACRRTPVMIQALCMLLTKVRIASI